MFGRFLQADAADLIDATEASDQAKHAAGEVIEKGYTIIPGAISRPHAQALITVFRRFEALNAPIFDKYRDRNGHYPLIRNLHTALPAFADLFARNTPLIETLDLLFGRPATLHTSLFSESGSQQTLHRDSPVFATRPDYMHFGTTIYLESADEQNGCLELLEGGHRIAEPDRERMARRRYGSLDAMPPFDNEIWSEYQNRVVNEGLSQGLALRKLSVEAGDTVIWHPRMPHGDSRIVDKNRTRFSMAMHTIPIDTPVYQQNAFFNPKADLPTELRHDYQETGARKIIDQRSSGIGFGPVDTSPLTAFRGVG
jgi:ectoine hydroxylase-related dioxygenase (phytanoyl-CoA dioxygenase family)